MLKTGRGTCVRHGAQAVLCRLGVRCREEAGREAGLARVQADGNEFVLEWQRLRPAAYLLYQ